MEEKNSENDQMCRACKGFSKRLSSVFQKPRNHDISFAEMLMGCASIQVLENDGLPSVICNKCIVQLKNAFNFKQQIETADQDLRSAIKTEIDLEEGEIDIKNENLENVKPEEHEDDNQSEHSNDTYVNDNISEHGSDDQDFRPPVPQPTNPNAVIINRCKICPRDFSCLSKLQRHMKIHFPVKKTYTCKLCNKASARKEHMKRHILANHVKTRPHICKTCARGFVDIDSMYAHEKNCTGQKPHVCRLCNQSFTREDSLKVHLNMHESQDVLRNPVLESMDDIENYIAVVEDEEKDPEFKNEETKDNMMMNVEFIEVIKPPKQKRSWKQNRNVKEKFECTDCSEIFEGPIKFKSHMTAEHQNPNPFTCKYCPKALSRYDHYKRHLISHKDRQYVCNLCPRKFTCESLLIKHLSTKHDETREKNFPCLVCNKMFITEASLRFHHKHFCMKNRTFNCKRCGLECANKEELIKHQKLANECSRRFLCSQCGQRFTKKEYLIIHTRRHTGERPFKCLHCEKAFARTSDLKSHEKSHTGEKNHICIVCGKGFARAYMLSVHMRTHPGEKPYVCELCPDKFVHSHALRLHMRAKHPDAIKPKYLL